MSNAGGFYIDFDSVRQLALIDYGDWTGVDLTAVQTAVTNVAQRTIRTEAKVIIDNLDIVQKAAWLVILDEINTIRASVSPPLTPQRTINQFFNAIKNKIDTL